MRMAWNARLWRWCKQTSLNGRIHTLREALLLNFLPVRLSTQAWSVKMAGSQVNDPLATISADGSLSLEVRRRATSSSGVAAWGTPPGLGDFRLPGHGCKWR